MLNTVETDQRPVAQSPPRPARPGKRLALVAVAGIGVAALLLVLGAVMADNAQFSESYVSRQLAEQRITFKPADALTPDERGRPCLVEFAGQALTTGKQAECYATQFIGVHLKSVADGKTFSELRGEQTALRAKLAEAQSKNDPSVPDLQRQLNDLTAKRQTLFEGESMKGLLLTSYGFDTLGQKAAQAATVARTSGIAILVISLLALGWALSRRRPA